MSLLQSSIDLARTRDRDQRTDGHLDNYIGHRAKIGVIIPSTNTSVEYDCQRVIPRGVTWHFSRFMIEHADLSDDENFMRFLEMLRQTICSTETEKLHFRELTVNCVMATDIVDMEAYALAKVARLYQIHFQCWKYISDNANDDAADHWAENVAKGARAFVEQVIRPLEN